MSQQNESIKSFVKDSLGCNCPDEVFSVIESEKNVKLNSGIEISRKIIIGNRLMVYIFIIENVDLIKKNMNEIIVSGKNERDIKGFNRLRIVMITKNSDLISKELNTKFKSNVNVDEKIHLHISKNSDCWL